ncbi:pseudaminic acid synthase [Alteromonas mediterranea]|uniref:pseudaminic acid synthase n=1 Tax=Alteromonas mediterranea TaxID=314275 RepID=UPI0009035BC9|nr:pseudaminic acid synthase [Alteromonas mediterranea]APD93348.1 pseudaminic acid synthase [Alteromonas mediterranea]APD96972.1 pseudaminic acid synthase [Alteromonas mediterranea]
MKNIKIDRFNVGEGLPPFIIAELSGNHNHDLNLALQMVDAAADAGVHALKLQTYTADTMTIDVAKGEFFIDDENSLWHGSSLYELYKKAYTPWEWHRTIFERAKARGMTAFSTPFDSTAVDFLESLDVPCYKIASFENTDHSLLAKVAKTGKPVIVSTGMASLAEIAEAVEVLENNGCSEYILLKCTSQYPADPVNANLATIEHMKQMFNCQVGLSDHTTGIGAAVAATALGATVIEKHFVIDRKAGGVDAAFSLEPAEFTALVDETKRAAIAVGKVNYGCTPSELNSRTHRRSLYVCEDLVAGDVLTESNLRAIRPGLGLAVKHMPTLLGKPVTKAVNKGTPMSWDLV